MGRSRWTTTMLDYLKNNYGKVPTNEIAKKLNKSIGAVKVKASCIGVSFNNLEVDINEIINFEEERHLCWKCKHSTNKPVSLCIKNGEVRTVGICSWADNLEPVKGWEIEYTREKNVIIKNKVEKRRFFKVIKCPLYESDDKIKKKYIKKQLL